MTTADEGGPAMACKDEIDVLKDRARELATSYFKRPHARNLAAAKAALDDHFRDFTGQAAPAEDGGGTVRDWGREPERC